MNFEKMTTKLQEALAESQSLAVGKDNAYIEPAHLLYALLKQEGGSVAPLLTTLNVNVPTFIRELQDNLDRLPQIQGGNTQVSQQLIRLLNQSDKLAQQLGDSFISSELFVLAAVEDSGDLGKLLKKFGLTKENITNAISQIRGGDTVNTQNAEETRQALQKYTIDLTERAKAGKLDPVIGRDEEIRRAVQVLQRRTKNNPVLIGEPGWVKLRL